MSRHLRVSSLSKEFIANQMNKLRTFLTELAQSLNGHPVIWTQISNASLLTWSLTSRQGWSSGCIGSQEGYKNTIQFTWTAFNYHAIFCMLVKIKSQRLIEKLNYHIQNFSKFRSSETNFKVYFFQLILQIQKKTPAAFHVGQQ